MGTDLQRDLMRSLNHLATLGAAPLSFKHCPAENIGDLVPPGTFDAVLALDVLEHVLDEGRALRGIQRACRTGGWIFIHLPREDDDSTEHVRSYSDEALGRLADHFTETQITPCVDELGRKTVWVYGRNP